APRRIITPPASARGPLTGRAAVTLVLQGLGAVVHELPWMRRFARRLHISLDAERNGMPLRSAAR
ncbi:MAG TPA: hypothetical protein VLE20_09430, partial [Blastocatellia bacterium]|nr:hypothetical protein [Blastocatellia bacterium]